MRIALVQAAALSGEAALMRSRRWLEEAARLDVQLVVLPSGFAPEFRRELARLAAQHRTAVAAGAGTELWLLDARGELQACTDSAAVVPLDGHLVGLASEDDAGEVVVRRHCHTGRLASDDGAQLLLVPGGTQARGNWFRALARRSGSAPAVAWSGPGNSFIATPYNGLEAEAGPFEELILADVQLPLPHRTVGPSWFARRYLSTHSQSRPAVGAAGPGGGS
jgi:predicted amidohydrolase